MSLFQLAQVSLLGLLVLQGPTEWGKRRCTARPLHNRERAKTHRKEKAEGDAAKGAEADADEMEEAENNRSGTKQSNSRRSSRIRQVAINKQGTIRCYARGQEGNKYAKCPSMVTNLAKQSSRGGGRGEKRREAVMQTNRLDSVINQN